MRKVILCLALILGAAAMWCIPMICEFLVMLGLI